MRRAVAVGVFLVSFLLGYIVRPYFLILSTTSGQFLFLLATFVFSVANAWLFARLFRDVKEFTEPMITRQELLVFGSAALLLFIGLYRLLAKPMRAISTERVHVQQALAWLEPLHLLGVYVVIRGFVVILLIALIIILLRRSSRTRVYDKVDYWYYRVYQSKWTIVVIGLFVVLWFFFMKKIFSVLPNQDSLAVAIIEPYGALMQFSNALWALIVGYSPVLFRVLPLLSTVLGGFIIYRIMMELGVRQDTAYISGLLYLFIPAITHFAANFYSLSTQMLFMAGSFYYFLRYIRSRQRYYLLMSTLVICLGALYHRLVILFMAAMWLFFVIEWLFDKNKWEYLQKNALLYIGCGWLVFAAILPKLLVKEFVVQRPTLFTFVFQFINFNVGGPKGIYENRLVPYGIQHIITSFSLIPYNMGVLLTVVFGMAIVAVLWQKSRRSKTTTFLFVYFFLFYFLVSSMNLIQPRWVIPSLIVPPVIIGLAIDKWSRIPKYVFGVLILVLCVVTFSMNTFSAGYQNSDLPNDEAFQYLHNNISSEASIYQMYMPYVFYERRHDLKQDFVYGVWNDQRRDIQTIDQFSEFVHEQGIDYVLIPGGDRALEKYDIGTIQWHEAFNLSFVELMNYYQLADNKKSWTSSVYNQTFINELIGGAEGYEVVRVFGTESKLFLVKVP